jgi:putative Mn2+ efflux pump MntP
MSMSFFVTLFALMVAMTNILVNVVKGVADVKHPRRVVLVVAVLLAAIAAVSVGVYLQFTAWYLWTAAGVAALLIGGLVAYVAMYGYDQGYDDIVGLIQKLVGYINGGEKNE